MRPLVLQAISFALILSLTCVASADTLLSPVTKIVSVQAVDGLGVLQIRVTPNFPTGGGCETNEELDIQLDAPGRSAEEQRLLLNAVYLAFMTNRNVRLHIRDDICSGQLRVVSGIQVLD